MRTLLRLAALLAVGGSAWGSYQYYVTDPLTGWSLNTSLWTVTGNVHLEGPSKGVYMGGGGASLLSNVPIPDGTSDGEVRLAVNATASYTGATTLFARATPGSLTGSSATGTYYAFEMQNATFTNGVCSATYVVWKRFSGSLTALGTWTAGCTTNMTLRLIVIGSTITVWYGNQPYPNTYQDSDIGSGAFGVGGYLNGWTVPAYLTNAQIGPADRIAPYPISAQSIGVSAFPTEVDLHWAGTLDDPNGIGMAGYQISRNGVLIGQSVTADFTDETVSASTTYTYSIASMDQHNNLAAATSTTLTTRPAGTVDPLRIGVRPTGSYWGAAGEQIDLLSGNLNFSLPLLKPQARGGWGMTVGISYNSQMWRQDSGGSWLLGEDIGYGLGWHVQAASVRPVWASNWVLDHYVYSDSTGAQYRLNQDNNGLWSSLEGVYVTFDQNANILHFNDGSFWTMGSESAGAEQDAGTMYPTTIEDSNGNQIQIVYQAGVGAGATNSSSRMLTIGDPRQVGSTPTYQFTYNSDSIPHLTSVASSVPGESFAFTYGTQQLNSPLTSASFGSVTTLLSSGQTSLGASNNFTYSSGGELTNYATPMSGALQWAYQTFDYADGVQYRQVQNRSMTPLSGGAQYTWSIQYDSASNFQHTYAIVADQGAGTQKQWWFNTAAGVYNGLSTAYEEREKVTNAVLRHKNFTWTTDSAGNAYTGTVATILNPGTSASVQTSTVQTLDIYGNVTQQQVYDYGNSSTPAHTYNYTYLTGSNYSPRYIFNRLTQATVTSPAGAITQQTIAYDGTMGAGQSGLTFYDSNYDNWNSTTYRGNPVSVSQMGTSLSYSYYVTGVPYQIVDGDGATISLTTDSSTAYSLPTALTPNSNGGYATNMAYSSSSFALTSVSGPNGAAQGTTYDSYNRPSTVTSLDGAVTTYAYAYNPNTLTASLSSPSTQWTATTYDGFGRTIKAQSGYGSVTVSTVDTQYGPCGGSPLGVVSQVSEPYGPGETEVWTTYTYDGSCRRLTTTNPDGSVTTNLYAGNTTKVTDAAGKYKTYVKDAFGNLISVVEPDPNSSGTLPTNYTYNAANQLTGVSMTRTVSGTAVTQTRSFTWSGSDLASSTNPENGTVTYQYDSNHHVTQRTDALGNSTTYSYDGYERLAGVFYGNNDYPTVQYYYDGGGSSGCGGSQNTTGRLSQVTFYGGNNEPTPGGFRRIYNYQYGYNTAGRVTQQALLMNWSDKGQSVNVCASYTWDTQGRPTSVTTPGGTVLNYSYDPVSRLSSISETAGGQTWTAASATYNSASLITSLAYGPSGSQFTENRTYNNLLQMTRATVTGSTGTTLMDMQYLFPAGVNNGKVSQTIDGVLGETVNYAYDSLNRLITATATSNAWGEAYSFDGFGNLQSKTPTVGSAPTGGGANPASNQPTSVTVDANGNNLGTSGATNTWDTENRMSSSPLSGTQTYYDYDPWGKRIWKEVPPNSSAQTPLCEFYFYGLGGQKLETFNCTYELYTVWTPYWYQEVLPGTYTSAGINLNFGVGGKLLQSKGAWVATDRQGSVRWNASLGAMNYWPYGEERTSAANGSEKFGTYMRDGIGQDYADQRYFNSNSGAFWNPDPGGIRTANPRNPTSWNRYMYGLGDPVNNSDPTGRIACDDDDDDGCYDPDSGTDCDDDGCDDGGCPVDTCVTVTASEDPAPTDPSTVYDLEVTFQVTSQPACQAGQTLAGPVGSAVCIIAPVPTPTFGMPSSIPPGSIKYPWQKFRPPTGRIPAVRGPSLRPGYEPPPVITTNPYNSPYGKWFAGIEALRNFMIGLSGGGSIVIVVNPALVPLPGRRPLGAISLQ